MISTSDFKRGGKILLDNIPYSIIEYHSVKPGKGGAYMRTKLKNMITGLIREKTFRSGEKFPEPDLEYKNMQFLYKDDTCFHFMDQDTYDQVILNKDQIEDSIDYLNEQVVYNILYFSEKPISINPPLFIELKIIETIPGVKGDTAQGSGNKPAKLETGLVVQVPLFICEGNVIKIDTRTGTYIERVDKK